MASQKLSALLQDDINRKDPQNGERRAILLDLWTDGSQLVDLPEEVHAAFEIPALGLTVLESLAVSPAASAKEAATPYEVAPKTAEPEVPDSLKKKLQELDNWNNQGILSQDLAKDIREFIHPAIVERIEWNTEMLLQGTFAGSSSKFFKKRNVTFYSPKVTRERIAGVRLSLPLNPEDEHEFRDTAIAFQGILQYKHYNHWNPCR